MAEVAIPLMAMGAMYIISNQNKEENFSVRNTSSQLPNTNPMVKNYPVLDKNAVKQEIQAYRGANPDTDFKPYCLDGEVEKFELMDWKKVLKLMQNTNSIKNNCNVVFFNFMVRHGLINNKLEKNYEKILRF